MNRPSTKNKKAKRASSISSRAARYAKKISALQASTDAHLKRRGMNYIELGALMEDTGNRFLDLAEEIRMTILARRSVESAPKSARTAAGPRR